MNFGPMCFPFHKWSKWTAHGKGILTESTWPFSEMTWASGDLSMTKKEKVTIGEFIVQKRECEICGKQELRTTRTLFRS
jgi:hypothetical protein